MGDSGRNETKKMKKKKKMLKMERTQVRGSVLKKTGGKMPDLFIFFAGLTNAFNSVN